MSENKAIVSLSINKFPLWLKPKIDCLSKNTCIQNHQLRLQSTFCTKYHLKTRFLCMKESLGRNSTSAGTDLIKGVEEEREIEEK